MDEQAEIEAAKHALEQPVEPERAPYKSWLEAFEERQQREIDLARLYVAQYNHGSPGHLHLQIIAKLAALLDERDGIIVEYTLTRELVG
jgi:hypothetical protein